MDGKEPTLVPVAESIDAPVVAPHVDRPSSPAATQSLELPAGQPVRDGSSAPAKQLDQSAEECSAPAIEHDEEEAHSPVNVVLTQSSQSPRASLTMEGSPLPLSTEQAGQNSSSTTSMDDQASTRSSADGSNNRTSTYSSGVDWDELGRNEEQEAGKDTSDESTAFLLARLEQANDALATDPKSGLPKVPKQRSTLLRRQSRPPSIHQLKSLLTAPTPPSLRYSLLPAPPPMTDLEFYAALVADYPRTAQYLPTLLSKKVRSGIPPPLRGVVWVSMTGARDSLLEEQYYRLSGEPSPYENMIGKDIGRSFPGVDMFREPGGEGQRMLGQVLKCFSLYDQKIGYCQGLGFLVGPLLMHMGEREAFIVLVRLMEYYDLRSCFLPDLSGLHLRIYQFRHLLAQHLPALAAHLEDLQVNPAYVSSWFLSFFAVTCPLPMLLRIYDVIFAEGASETLMRVALSLMRRNEKKLMACTELEEAMQLLLSRGVWDAYGYDADDFVNDFVDMTSAVARDGLLLLEASFKEAKQNDVHSKLGSLPDLQAAASRFLGRFWAGSGSSTKSTSLSPDAAASSSRPNSLLHRSPSKHSLASTLNSFEAASDSGGSGVSSLATELTVMSRQTSMESAPQPPKLNVGIPTSASSPLPPPRQGKSVEKDLHGQIEDLVTALSEMQKSQALLGSELQRERDARRKDAEAVQQLTSYLRRADPKAPPPRRTSSPSTSGDDRDRAGEEQAPRRSETGERPATEHESETDELPQLLEAVEEHFSALDDERRRAPPSTEADTRLELDLLKVQYEQELMRTQQLGLRLNEQKADIAGLGESLKSARARVQESHKEKERLHLAMQEMRSRRPSETTCSGASSSTPVVAKAALEAGNRRSSTYAGAAGLREFRLTKAAATGGGQGNATFSRRTSSLNFQAVQMAQVAAQSAANQTVEHQGTQTEPVDAQPSSAEETLLHDLVNAKTAEASAKQEADELRSKLDSLRRLIGTGDGLGSSSPPTTATGTVAELAHGGKHPSIDAVTTGPRNLFNSLLASSTAKKADTPAGDAGVGGSTSTSSAGATASTGTTLSSSSAAAAAAGSGGGGGGGGGGGVGGFWGTWGKRSTSNNTVTEA